MVKYLAILYQKTAKRFIRPCCRYYPSCSDYLIEATERFGDVKGAWLGIKRLLKCNQFYPGGYDPVPEKE